MDKFLDRCRSMMREVFAMCLVLTVLGLVMAGLNWFGAGMVWAGVFCAVGAAMYLAGGLISRKIKVPDNVSITGIGIPAFLVLAGLVGVQIGSGVLAFSGVGQVLLMFTLAVNILCLAKLWFVWSVCDLLKAGEPKPRRSQTI